MTYTRVPLTVAKLIERLQTFHPDAAVVIDCVDSYYSREVCDEDLSLGAMLLIGPHDAPRFNTITMQEYGDGSKVRYHGGWQIESDLENPPKHVIDRKPCVKIWTE